MKQVLQNVRAGEVKVADVPPPALRGSGAIVGVRYSVISAGTERAAVSFGSASLIGKVRSRPDLVKQVITSMRTHGVQPTIRKALARIGSYQALGYSCAGTVQALDGVEEYLTAGQAVACAGVGYANHAEIVYAPRNLCVPVPSGVSLADAAFATIGAVAMQGVRRAESAIGETVAVFGCGLIGLLTVQIIVSAGCHVIAIDPNEQRVALARGFGARAGGTVGDTEFAANLGALTRGRGVDCAIITAATKAPGILGQASSICRDRGRIVIVGDVPIEAARSPLYLKELDVRLSRSYGPGRYDPSFEEKGIDYPIGYVRWTETRNMEAFLDLLASGQVRTDPLTTHRFPVDEADRAYGLLTGAVQDGTPPLGIVLEYPAEKGMGGPPRMPIVVTETPAKRLGTVVKLGVVGAGGFAVGVLLPLLKEMSSVRLESIASASGVSARTAAERVGFRTCAASFDEVADDANVDALVIATRHDSHAGYVERAIAAGKHVFVEKPLCIDWRQFHQVATALNGHRDLAVVVGYNRRFAPQYRRLRAAFAARTTPMLTWYRVDAGSIPPGNWVHDPAIGGGRLIGEGCHFIDLLMHLVDREVVSVETIGAGAAGNQRADDNLAVTLRFADGSIGQLLYTAAGSGSFGKERLEVFCGGRTAVLDDYRRLSLSGARPVEESVSQQKGHAEELKAFVHACLGGPTPISRQQLLDGAAVTLLALDSLRLGRPLTLADVPLVSAFERDEDWCAKGAVEENRHV